MCRLRLDKSSLHSSVPGGLYSAPTAMYDKCDRRNRYCGGVPRYSKQVLCFGSGRGYESQHYGTNTSGTCNLIAPREIPLMYRDPSTLLRCCQAKKKTRNRVASCGFLDFWSLGPKWSGAGSNRRHMDFQSIALPTELPDRVYLLRLSINSTNYSVSCKSFVEKLIVPIERQNLVDPRNICQSAFYGICRSFYIWVLVMQILSFKYLTKS